MTQGPPKAVIIIVVCLLILFLAGVTLGQCGACSAPDADDLDEWAARLFPEPTPVAQHDIVWTERGSSGPWNQRRLNRLSCDLKAATCASLHVAQSRTENRVVELVTRDPLGLRVIPEGDHAVPMSFNTSSGAEQAVELQFDEEGGVVWIQCKRSSGRCTVLVQ